MRQAWTLTITLALLILVSGCAGPIGTQPTEEPGTETPSETPTVTSTPTPAPDITSFDVKVAVRNEYDPGTSFGMPSPASEQMMNKTVADNPELVDNLIAEYDGVERGDNHTLYYMIQQFHQIQVTELSNGTYEFTVKDGNSCIITTIEGVYTPSTGEIRETNVTEETVPC